MADPKDKLNAEAMPELPVDREQGLALQFDDPGIAELLPLMSDEAPAESAADPSLGASSEPFASAPSLTEEVAEAVQELVFDLSDGNDDELAAEGAVPGIEGNAALDFDLGADLAAGEDGGEPLSIEGTGIETAHNIARIQLADRMFELMVTEKSFNDLSESLLGALIKASSGTAGSILELDHERNEFFFRAVFGSNDPDKVKAFRVPAGKGIVGHVAESRQPLLLNDVEGDERQLKAISMSAGLEIDSFMALPILITNRLYGVVEIFNKSGGRFDKADLQLTEDGTRMAAKVLEVRFLMAEFLRKVKG